MTTSSRRTPLAWAGAALAVLATLVMLTVAQAAVAKQFEGKVVSKNAAEQTFRLDRERRGIVRIAVNDATKYQRIDGFGGIEKGMRLEAIAQRSGGHWLASKVEKKH